tara:strand:- start:48 stop:395 length:348 start_codon:yes stop_codon:yes gene_type:complete
MKKRIIITTLVVAGMHLVLAVSSVVLAISSRMEAFDNIDYQPSGVWRFADHLAAIIMQPGMSLWTPWMSKNMPDVVEWGFFLINSLLWGIVLALILNALVVLKERRSDNDHVLKE